MFISINGFTVLDEKILRKRWKDTRKIHLKFKRRIHATDSHFKKLKENSIKLLGRHDVNILSIFQMVQEIPSDYFDEEGIKFDQIYTELLKKLFLELSLEEYQNAKIIVDARQIKGGKLAEKEFKTHIEKFLKKQFPKTNCHFKITPSYMDILVELADFVSNIFYGEYQNDTKHVFDKLGFRLIQIKNPL